MRMVVMSIRLNMIMMVMMINLDRQMRHSNSGNPPSTVHGLLLNYSNMGRTTFNYNTTSNAIQLTTAVLTHSCATLQQSVYRYWSVWYCCRHESLVWPNRRSGIKYCTSCRVAVQQSRQQQSMSRRSSHSWSKQLLFSQISCFPSHPFTPLKLSVTETDMSLM